MTGVLFLCLKIQLLKVHISIYHVILISVQELDKQAISRLSTTPTSPPYSQEAFQADEFQI